MFRDFRSRHDSSGMTRQVFEQRVLLRRQIDLPQVARDSMAGCLDNQIVDFELRWTELWVTPEQSSHASQQLAKRKRFAQIVIRAGVESVDAIINRGASGQHQHRRSVAARSQLAADVESIPIGKYDI